MTPLPCPFCNRIPVVNVRASNATKTGEWHTIACFCGGYSSTAWQGGDTYEAVLVKWNTRNGETPEELL